MSRWILVTTIVSLTSPALASPEKAQQRAEEDYVRKINFACGTNLTVAYDAASLKKNDIEISRDQTDGANECNEPLRYLHYACATAAGKAAVKAARITKIVCKGTASKTGTLTVQGGTITLERAFQEAKPFERSRRQFEQALNVKLALPDEGDPYTDEKWRDLGQQPNPTKMRATAYWDTGKVREEGVMVNITQDEYGYSWSDWCPDGLHKGYYENGAPESEESYQKGKRHGTSKSWWPSGKQESVEEYADGKITKAKYWDKDGKLTVDEEYEADGSRKLKR